MGAAAAHVGQGGGGGATAGQLRTTLRLAAVSDLHCTLRSAGTIQPLFAGVQDQADVLLLCGDLTDHGLPEEGQLLLRELSQVRIPVIAVLGNHDFETGQQEELKRVLVAGGLVVLDGSNHELFGAGFAGVKGFAGGFGRRALAPWGEAIIKTFVREGVEEALKLEAALAKMWTPVKVVVLHYSPIRETVTGEPVEVMAFLGSSRLEDPVDRYRATVVFHGHAHRGSLEGHTRGGTPVYNVSLPLLRANQPQGPSWRVVEVPLSGPGTSPPGTPHPPHDEPAPPHEG